MYLHATVHGSMWKVSHVLQAKTSDHHEIAVVPICIPKISVLAVIGITLESVRIHCALKLFASLDERCRVKGCTLHTTERWTPSRQRPIRLLDFIDFATQPQFSAIITTVARAVCFMGARRVMISVTVPHGTIPERWSKRTS